MGIYILKRILLMIPTLFGVMLMTFAVIQFVPGGPIERIISQIQGTAVEATARFGGGQGGEVGSAGQTTGGVGDMSGGIKYRGAQGLDPEFIKKQEGLGAVVVSPAPAGASASSPAPGPQRPERRFRRRGRRPTPGPAARPGRRGRQPG